MGQKMKNSVNKIKIINIGICFFTLSLFIAFILISGSTRLYCQDKITNYKILFSGNLGGNNNEFGGLTNKQLTSKDDPIAYLGVAQPQDFTVDNLGNIIVSDTANGRIKKFTKEGILLFSVDGEQKERIKFPSKVAVNSNNEIIVSEGNGSFILIFTPSGKYLSKINTLKLGITQIDDIVIDKDGYILIYKFPERTYKLAIDGTIKEEFSSYEVVIGPDGSYWSKSIEGLNDVTFPYKPSGDWEGWEFLAIDEKYNFYVRVLGRGKGEEYILITDMNGNINKKIDPQIGRYYLYNWHITKNGDLYALGVDREKMKNFIRVFKIIID